ncbi:MAG: CocE/NonD family hydrolase, partial [Litorilinea sp.]
TSYAAWTQNALAAYNPPHLTCMWVNEGASNGYTSTLRQGGALELRFLCWAYWHSATNTQAALKANPAVGPALNAVDMRDILNAMPPKPGQTPLALAPAYEKWAFEILCRGDFDALWEDPSVNFEKHWPATADVPTLFSSAWYDSYTRANLESYLGLAALKKGPYHLLMGPWTHGDTPIGASFAGDVEFGPNAALDYNALRLRWFDHWLKDRETDLTQAAPVHYFVMGGGDAEGVARKNRAGRLQHGGFWQSGESWPPPATLTPYYLHPGGRLTTEVPGATPEAADAATTYRFDPLHPVPTIGGSVSSLARLGDLPPHMADPDAVPGSLRLEQVVAPGGFDQRTHAGVFGAQPPFGPLAARQDVLVFSTEPLDAPLRVVGPIEVKLWVASDAPDTDFTAKLVDVYPPSVDYPQGYALNITDGIQRMRYRDSDSHPTFLTPGERYAVTIVLYPTANIFGVGHRIRLDISSSNFPRFDVNPNTGEPLGQNTRTQVANNTVCHNAVHCSHVMLPIAAP